MSPVWDLAIFVLYLSSASALLVLCAWLYPRSERFGAAGGAIVGAAGTMAAWGLLVAALGFANPAAQIALSLSHLAWFLALFRLFVTDGRDSSLRPIRPVVIMLAAVEVMQIAVITALARLTVAPSAVDLFFNLAITLRLLSVVGALVLVHNLYVGATTLGRLTLRWPAAALGLMWLYDLNLYGIAYMTGEFPALLASARGGLMLVMALLLTLGAARQASEIRLRPSRYVAFQSFSLFVIGAYLVGMVLVAQALTYLSQETAWLIQVGFLAAAIVAALLVLPSRKLRGWIKVMAAKHLFQHRYDYRVEWLRFTQTIAKGDEDSTPLRERVVQAVADITDSPAGLLLTPSEGGAAVLNSRWQWGDAEVPAEALSPEAVEFLEKSQFILNLDDVRAGHSIGSETAFVPDWLMNNSRAWIIVPLLHFERLVGMVVLTRPAVARKLDWEDFDLLRVVGKQLASYLAEQDGQEALGEAHRFDEFNRRIAFVMHDIKNLASQLSLLARNAEKYADNPEFRADMLVTLRNSSDKLEALLARLGRYRAGGGDRESMERIDAGSFITRIAERFQPQHPVQIAERQSCELLVDSEGFDQALVHLVQNAIDASDSDQPVLLLAACDELFCRIEIIDSGKGMSPEFIRTRLFKPFQSSKSGGFGIGAFEARELLRAMGGQLSVESREGVGTRFIIRLPLADTARLVENSRMDNTPVNTEVA